MQIAPTSIPDHSLLSWNVKCEYSTHTNDDVNYIVHDSYDKFDRSYFSSNFLGNIDVLRNVNNTNILSTIILSSYNWLYSKLYCCLLITNNTKFLTEDSYPIRVYSKKRIFANLHHISFQTSYS